MDELISRKFVLEAVGIWESRMAYEPDYISVVKVVESLPYVTPKKIVTCRDCKHRFVDGENVRFNVCELNHNKVQADDWFCADGERRSENERPD